MFDRELILRRISKIEDKMLVSKLMDKAIKASHTGKFVFSDFLDPYQKRLIDKVFCSIDLIDYKYNGGYQGAEREIMVFCPKNMSLDDHTYIKMPLKVIEISLRNMNSLTHRDFLGALMGLGIKREKVGDILLEEDVASIIAINDIADFIRFNLFKIGSIKVDAEIKDIEEIRSPQQKLKEIKGTVASMRLDCIASAGFGISRSKIAEYIKAEKVSINWEKTVSLTKEVKEGDTISIRGKGRVILDSIGGATKKGRISVLLKKLI